MWARNGTKYFKKARFKQAITIRPYRLQIASKKCGRYSTKYLPHSLNNAL